MVIVKQRKKVVIYVRVSTQEQAKEGYSIGEQIERLTKYCEAMGWEIVEVYVDPGYSGGDINRPGLTKMLKDIANGGIDMVVVYKLDRLSRSQKDTLFLIEDEFLKHGTDFVSMNENFDTSTPFGRAMIGILAVFAQLEREQIKERMTMGKEARAKEGKFNGGRYVPVGYDYDPAKDLFTVNEYEAMQYKELVELFLSGMPLRTIDTLFREKGYTHKNGTWDPKNMRRVLRSKVYLGYISYHGEYYKAEHDALIDEETYKRVVRLLDQRAEQYRLTGVTPGAQTTYFGGLLYCKHCGGKYTKQGGKRRKDGTRPLYYCCYSRNGKVKKMIKDPNCKNKNWKMEELDALIIGEIRKLAEQPDYMSKIRTDKPKTDDPSKIDIIEREIAKIDDQISRFMDLYGIGKFTIDQVSSKIDPLNDQRRGLQKELETLNSEAGRLTEDEAREILATFEDVIDGGDFDEIRFLIESLIYFVELDDGDIFIHWKFA